MDRATLLRPRFLAVGIALFFVLIALTASRIQVGDERAECNAAFAAAAGLACSGSNTEDTAPDQASSGD